MANPVVHFELWSKNPETLSDFYKKAFDWEIDHMPDIDYHLVRPAGKGGIGGGIMTPQKGDWPSDLTFYIDVDDLAGARKRITDAGGKIIVEEMEVPNVGSFCLFSDPDGRVLGCWKQGEGGGDQ